MILEDYLREMENLKKQYIIPETEDNYEECLDEEEYHHKMDAILLNIIEDLGYDEVVKKYKEARKHFWYS